MVSDELRNQMEQAYISGNYNEALKLSQQLDIQILEAVKNTIIQ